MINNILQRIKTLPPLPDSFRKIDAICAEKNGTVEQLARAIEEDPMLVAGLLKVANSPLYGLRGEVKSVIQAVSMFGMATTKALVSDMSIKKLLKIDTEPYGLTPEYFVYISALQASLIKQWYCKVDNSKLDVLFLAALLQETGKILIADEIVKSNEVIPFRSEIQTSMNISQVEKSFIGATASDVTSHIFEHWRLDETMVEAIKYVQRISDAPTHIQEYSSALKIIKTAVPINAPLSERSVAMAMSLVSKYGFGKVLFLEAIDQVMVKMSSLKRVAKIY